MVSVGMILIHMIGSMAVAGISANAISLVNLVMVRTYTVCVYGVTSPCMHLVGSESFQRVLILLLELVRNFPQLVYGYQETR